MENQELKDDQIFSGLIECEFILKIERSKSEENDKEKYRAYRIKRDMAKYLYEYLGSPFRNENIIREEDFRLNAPQRFVNQIFIKHFKFMGNGKAYLSDYREKEGSLIITFTVVVVGTFLNYGGIRETIDYFVDDLEQVCEMAMGDKYDTNVSHKEKTKILSVQSETSNSQNNPNQSNNNEQALNTLDAFKQIEKKISANRILIGITIFVLMLLVAISVVSEPSLDSDSKKAEIENLIEDKIKEERQNQLINGVYAPRNFRYEKGDTVIIGVVK